MTLWVLYQGGNTGYLCNWKEVKSMQDEEIKKRRRDQRMEQPGFSWMISVNCDISQSYGGTGSEFLQS